MLSLAVALLAAGASLAGLIWQNSLYPSQELRQSFVSNDVVNLCLGLPLLLLSLALARGGRLIGLLCWPGALFYFTYNYIAYAIAIPLTVQFIFYLAVVVLSAYSIYSLLSGMDKAAIRQRLSGAVAERFASGVLIGLGALFILRGLGQTAGALFGQGSLSRPEWAVLAADLITMPFWVMGGIWLWRKQALGYASGVGLLFQGSMLFIGLLVFFILQPFLAAVPFPVEDFVVILVMGLVCFVPFGLFVHGVIKRS